MLRLWRITERLNTLHEANWTAETRVVVDKFASSVVAAAGEGYRDGQKILALGCVISNLIIFCLWMVEHSRNLCPIVLVLVQRVRRARAAVVLPGGAPLLNHCDNYNR